MATTNKAKRLALSKDATNRTVRTFLVNIATDVAVAVVLLLFTTFQAANGWGDIEWALLLFSLVKTVVVSAGAYVLRRFLDPSGVPTPLPPSPVPEPNV